MKWLGFIVLLTLLIPMPAMAIGVSPYTVDINVSASSYTELVFTVTGSSEVDVSLEGIPLTVEPSHTLVVDDKITVRISGITTTGIYTGYLVILESGEQVGAGVKVSLTVNYTNKQSVALTTTVLSSGSSEPFGSGGVYYAPVEQPRKVAPLIPNTSNTLPTPPTMPVYGNPNTEDTTVTYIPPVTPETPSSINWWLILLLIVGIIGLVGLIWYLKSRRTV